MTTTNGNSVPDRILRVSELVLALKGHLETRFALVRVQGEASNVTLAPSGHLYFTLKDGAGSLRTVMFRYQSMRSSLRRVENGQQVVVTGTVSVYAARGEMQLLASDIQLQGRGDIYAALEELKQRYLAKGYFAAERKRRLPLMPRVIGVVTSPTGAAIRDIVQVMRRRFPSIQLLVYPARVQGEEAAREIAAGIEYFNGRPAGDVDVLIVGRGGGSYEDLWAFNEAPVVEAIYASRIPVISAVGHEVDFTIADFVADLRAPTPSAAAELVVGRREEFEQRLDLLCSSLQRLLERQLGAMGRRLTRLAAESELARFPGRLRETLQRVESLDFACRDALAEKARRARRRLNAWCERFAACDPVSRVRRQALLLRQLGLRLQGAEANRARAQRERLDRLQGRLLALSPQAVLDRGYSVTFRADGRVARDAAALQDGERLRIRLARGETAAHVEKEPT